MNKQNFQIIIYVIFGLLVIVGFGSLALYGLLKKNEQSSSAGGQAPGKRERVEIIVWGTIDANKAEPLFRGLHGGAKKGYDTVQYREKNAETIADEFARAIAYDQRAPDLMLLESAEVLTLENTALRTIPFGYYPIVGTAEYQKVFTPSTHIFLRPDGYIALPIATDSLVLYYNEGLRRQRDLRQLPKTVERFDGERVSKSCETIQRRC